MFKSKFGDSQYITQLNEGVFYVLHLILQSVL